MTASNRLTPRTWVRWAAPAAVCGALLTSTAWAVDSSPAKKELVQKVLALQQPGIEAFARTVVIEQPVSQLMQAAGRALQEQPADKREAMGKAIEGDIKKYVDDISPAVRKRAQDLAPSTVGTLLDERMSEDELKTLVAWLESPVSRKYGQLQPDMQQALGAKLVEQSRPTIEPKLKSLQQSVASRLGLNPPAAEPGAAPATKAPAKK